MARDFAKAFYKSKEWLEVRQGILMRDHFLCCNCGAPATEVHHIVHLSPDNIGDLSVSLNPKNLKSVCKDCHFEEHRGEHGNGRKAQEEVSYYFDASGMIQKKGGK